MSHRLTIKGQVTIPKEVRDFLNLQEGASSVEFSIGDDGTVIVRKAQSVKPRYERTSVRRVETPGRHGGVLALLAGHFA